MGIHRVDKAEPRWQAILAFVAVAGIYLALPSSLIVGPIWLLPTLIGVLLVPTVVSHRLGKISVNRILGLIISAIITVALISSVVLLVHALPSHRERPLQLLLSAALLWLTNVIVFALWYWRIDGGGPTKREELKEFGSSSFLFPQMQIPKDERGHSPAPSGVRSLSITSLSPLPKAPPSGRPMPRSWPAGRRCWR